MSTTEAKDTAARDKVVLHKRTLGNLCDPRSAVIAMAGGSGAFVLESVCDTRGYGRYTIVGTEPIDVLTAEATPPNTGRPSTGRPDAFDALARAVERMPTVDGIPAPFACGWVGYIPYEIGADAEGVEPRLGVAPPAMRFHLYDCAAIYDHAESEWTVCAVELPDSTTSAPARLDRLEHTLRAAPSTATAWSHKQDSVEPTASVPQSNMTKGEYLEKVASAIRFIQAGDIYEVNLTQRFTTRTMLDPLSLYLRLRETNPADYAAYLSWGVGDRVVLSASPELFLDVLDRRVVTRPIKGTARRGRDRKGDAKKSRALLASEKDRAELNMIIDLMRNDLGRVCQFGSVRVTSSAEVEAHPTVLHLVATIQGRLRDGVSSVDLLRATFPGGSITGCPKIRAMEIIRELEQTPRDVYCGSIGYIGPGPGPGGDGRGDGGGRMCMNIAIRTMLYEAGVVHVYSGGAITADSDPESEYQETLDKAAGMFAALGCGADVVERVQSGAVSCEGANR